MLLGSFLLDLIRRFETPSWRCMSRKRESYTQVTQQFLAQLDARNGHPLSIESEQRDLRLRMTRFRLLSDQQMQRNHQHWPSSESDPDAASAPLLQKYRQQAVDREKTKERRHALARCIQRHYRAYAAAKRRLYSSSIHWTLVLLARIKIYALRMKTRAVRHRQQRCTRSQIAPSMLSGEIELQSVSIAVPLDSPAVEVLSAGPIGAAKILNMQQSPKLVTKVAPSAPSQDYAMRQLPSYELVVELLSGRDIFRALPATAAASFEADIRVLTQSNEEMSTWPKRVVFVPMMSEIIHWENETLSVVVQTKPESVIEDWTIHLQLQAHYQEDGLMNAKPLGRIIVPLSLLESPLSMSYELCRWFPLEKSAPGEITRGEIRLRVRYLMRALEDQTEIMIPYKPKFEAKPSLENGNTAPRTTMRMKRSASVRPTGLQRRRSSDLSVNPKKATPSPANITHRQEQRMSKPRPRAEALSPPSSPSSVSSGSPSPIRSPHRDSGRRRSSVLSCSSQKLNENTLDHEEQVPDPAPTTTGPARAFLKRKPYKVIFRKIDWSKVSAKTDSKWSTQQIPASAPSNTSNSEPTKPSTSMPRPLHQAKQPVHAATERIRLLSEAMYACCHVSPQTAAIAQLKYQSERKSYVGPSALSVSASNGITVIASKEASPPLEESALCSQAAMEALYKRLAYDSTGEIYASLLEPHYKK